MIIVYSFINIYIINDFFFIVFVYISYCYFVIFIWWSPFIPSRNLDAVFTYNHIWLLCPLEAALMLRHPWF